MKIEKKATLCVMIVYRILCSWYDRMKKNNKIGVYTTNFKGHGSEKLLRAQRSEFWPSNMRGAATDRPESLKTISVKNMTHCIALTHSAARSEGGATRFTTITVSRNGGHCLCFFHMSKSSPLVAYALFSRKIKGEKFFYLNELAFLSDLTWSNPVEVDT